jgi:hypothetical protein
MIMAGGNDLRAAGKHASSGQKIGLKPPTVRYDRHRLCSIDYEREMLGRQIGRAENNAACDAIEFNEGHRRGELILGSDEHGPAAQFFGSATKR